MNNQKLITIIAFTALAAFAPLATANDWTLDSTHSSLGFVSVKNGLVVESHNFRQLSGSIEAAGSAELVINLDSVNTQIPIRDERIRSMLFNTEKYREAVVRVNLDMSKFSALKSGSSAIEPIKATLSLNGTTAEVMTTVSIFRSTSHVVISNVKPLILNPAVWGLNPGIEALRAIANLTSISPAVPVSFTLKYDLNEQ